MEINCKLNSKPYDYLCKLQKLFGLVTQSSFTKRRVRDETKERLRSRVRRLLKMASNKTALVLDNGSDTIKAGFAKEETPHTVLTSVVGYPESAKVQEVADRDDPFIGQDALHSSCNLDLTFPITNSIITNWDDMQMVSVEFRFDQSCCIACKWLWIFYRRFGVARLVN